MHSLVISLCLFSIAVAQDSTELIDSSGSGIVKPSDLESNDPMSHSDSLNLLAYKSEVPNVGGNDAAMIPETYNNNPVPNLDSLNHLAYSSNILHDLSNILVVPETYNDGGFSNSDAVSSGSLETHLIVAPDLNPSDPPHLVSPISAAPFDKSESDDGLMSNSDHNLISLTGNCASDNSATKRDQQNPLSCINPRIEYHKTTGQSDEVEQDEAQQNKDIHDLAEKDFTWKRNEFDSERKPRVSDEIREKCNSVGALLQIPLIAMCCLGPSHIFGRVISGGYTYYFSDEENCGFNWKGRPICLNVRNRFCCQKVGRKGDLFGLSWGENCIPMFGLPNSL